MGETFVTLSFADLPKFAEAMRVAAPGHLRRATGRALFKIGKADIEKMKREQVEGGRVHGRSKGFINSFKFKASDSREVRTIDQLQLSEYTGAKPFRIFQTGGEIRPEHSRTLTVLGPGMRNASGRRKYTPEKIRAMIESGEAEIIKTSRGAMIVTPEFKRTKTGKMRRQSKVTIIAYLKPIVHELKRIDFFGNFESNSAQHEAALDEAATVAIDKTIEGK